MYEEFLGPDFRRIGYILQDEEVVLERISGYRDYANELPNTIDTKFAGASAGKRSII